MSPSMNGTFVPIRKWFSALLAFLLFLSLISFPLPTKAATINVSNNAQLAAAVANANPGDVIVLANGSYSGLTISTQGTAASPIEIRAANKGQAVFNSGTVYLQGASYTTLTGLKITTSGTTMTIDGKSRKVGVFLEDCNYCRVSSSTFQMNASGTTEWLLIGGNSNYNRVDYNEFGPNTQGGHYIMTLGESTIPGVTPPSDRTNWANYQSPYNPNMARNTQIDHNYFRDNTGGETICIGCIGMTGDYQDLYTVIEHNLFSNCDGDAEIVALKGSNNTIRYNTILTSKGMLSSRAGNKNSIHGNFMLQGNKSGAGGIKFYEKDHKIYNNYIEGASEYPILFGAGDSYTSSNFSHAQVFRATVVNNTIVNANNRPVIIGHGSNDRLPPMDSVFANNIVTGSASALINERVASNIVFSKNIAQGNLGTTATSAEFNMTNPQFTTVNNLQKLSANSPAIDYANTAYTSFVTSDMDGQARSTPDTGADEYSTATIVNRPLTAADVGPNAPGAGGGGGNGGGTLSGYYKIVARHSGKVATVQNASTADGANIFQYTYGGSQTNDEWELVNITGTYYKVLSRHSGKAMAVASASTADGANVIQYTYGGSQTNDEWSIEDAGGGYYKLVNRHSGKVLEVQGSGTANGDNIVQNTWNGGNNQQWELAKIN